MKVFEIKYRKIYIAESRFEDKTFQLCANYLAQAFERAMDCIEEFCDSEGWEILSLAVLDWVDIVNFVDVEDDCNCPYCRAKETVLDKQIRFHCPDCNQELVLAEDGWAITSCKQCERILFRKSLSFKNGAWEYDTTNEPESTDYLDDEDE